MWTLGTDRDCVIDCRRATCQGCGSWWRRAVHAVVWWLVMGKGGG